MLPPMSASAAPGKLPPFYTQIWRWHFYAGLLVAPIMVMLAVTGLIYLYKPQLDALMYAELLQVPPASVVQPASVQQAQVAARWPSAQVLQYLPASAAGQSSSFLLAEGEQRWRVFVEPATARILGSRDEVWNLQAVAKTVHGSLLLGDWGDRLIELAACWGLILLISGLYLWWPRAQGWAGVLYIRLRGPRRLFWRDLHAVTAIWASGLMLFMLLSGLPWTGFWGEQFADIWNRYPAGQWRDVPQSALRSLNGPGQQVPWAVEPSPLPQSQHAGHVHGAMGEGETVRPGLDLDGVMRIAAAEHMPAGYQIALPRGVTGVYTVSASPDDPRGERTVHIDQYSGRVLARIGFADYGLVPKLVTTGIALHEGRLFGLANQLLMTLACLAIVLVAASGLIMWWQRRPRGRLGAPQDKPGTPAWRAAWAILLLMALAFPLVLVSLAGVMLLDLALGRLPALRRRLS